MPSRSCEVTGCESPHQARGMCVRHYNRWHYSGSPEFPDASTTCIGCGDLTPIPASGPRAKWCSRKCRSNASYARHAVRYRAEKRAQNAASRPERQCPCCEVRFVPELTVSQIYCSLKCNKRMCNAARRARLRGLDAEKLHWRTPFVEDGPACHICGIDVEPADFEVIDGFHHLGLAYPTLDHIVALANGGLHIRSNVALAHLYCNSVKSDRSFAA